ncbi:hypothetical protein LSH36_3121g00000 [Paralvinella palmiformis]|uniref:Uncharacterized protein n=1 Tax=Paralvinella palmiformis TaxID=53620 RepID=A0AAD9MMZ8_9ANNE|nr:hypothetical protein LSH36_3121g00000 [Paralvinella palmiformis]
MNLDYSCFIIFNIIHIFCILHFTHKGLSLKTAFRFTGLFQYIRYYP